ncbi:MAG: response regulator [Rhodospirillales bacterium]|nr:response regulator [Rhodospirillales bacterium]
MPSVLLVEDEFLIRAVLVDALGDVGLACIEAPTGQAALDVIASATPLSAVIVDIGLPDMSGERIIEAAARHRPGMPIIRCSGRPGPVQEIPGVKVHVYPKPYDASELSKFVVALMAASA